ncbi:MAG: chromate efflux transporter [Spirochaetaceae bacterium]
MSRERRPTEGAGGPGGAGRSEGTGVSRRNFLTDVFMCSLSAYGGPESHFGVFLNRLVHRRGYLSERELVELLALCSILPGPTSTQTIVSVGHRVGGRTLALLTMFVWALPVLFAMSAASFAYDALAHSDMGTEALRFVPPIAVGFILYAAVRIGRKVVSDALTAVLLVLSATVTFFLRAPWVFPVVLVLGGAVALAADREPRMWERGPLRPPWIFLGVFGALALGGLLAAAVSGNLFLQLAESFYRYGYLVFGGGQVVVPVMQSELVGVREYMSNAEFLTGYGLVQGLPGPMFSFAAYAGGMAGRGLGVAGQALAAAIGGVGIFLPGLLLIYFVYPLWEDLKRIRAVRLSLRGVNAVAGGLIAVSAVVLASSVGPAPGHLALIVTTAGLLFFTRVPPPLMVAAALAGGVVL